MNKLWWEKGIIFIPKQIFTKAHYDYIEKTFIKRFRQYKIELDNVTDWNTSPITIEEIDQAEMFMSNVTTVLDKLFGKNIFMLTKDNYTKYLENLVNQLLDDTLEKKLGDRRSPNFFFITLQTITVQKYDHHVWRQRLLT